MVNHINMEHSDDELRRFWDLETIEIIPSQEKPLTTEDSRILQEFRDSYRVEDGRSRTPPEEEYLGAVSESRHCRKEVPYPPEATTAR